MRRGYDVISRAYRTDDGASHPSTGKDTGRYQHWVAELGADMFWDHADTQAYLRWFRESRLIPVWHRFVPEGNTGHGLILATAA